MAAAKDSGPDSHNFAVVVVDQRTHSTVVAVVELGDVHLDSPRLVSPKLLYPPIP